ncbi:hypothetical protein EJ06DRAFT_532788 [Trichodelitschia bisporula]|uniref:Uncharacterized protein n=1 Tax=Trichodelitschia bisporula TaxID=703511 RepID=A0A6G1HP48_9PEZI|nr:hypothetical protein EJ06DRAFT_532788 [Trichodelitschia bisporula]
MLFTLGGFESLFSLTPPAPSCPAKSHWLPPGDLPRLHGPTSAQLRLTWEKVCQLPVASVIVSLLVTTGTTGSSSCTSRWSSLRVPYK